MKYIKKFKELNNKDANLAGGKGASLGEMIRNNIPVPDGFVVTTKAFDYFLEKTGLKLKIDKLVKSVDVEEAQNIEIAAEQIKKMILIEEIPLEIQKEILVHFKRLKSDMVAVRSSATAEDGVSAAWAGQLESYLNTSEKKLLINVKNCWSSLFGARAIFYRIEQGLRNKRVSVAVVIQKMINSECSGIAFSINPILNDTNQIVIDAGYGLGEAVVGGLVTPNNYQVAKDTLCILNKTKDSQKRKIIKKASGGNRWVKTTTEERNRYTLSDEQIKKLSSIVLKIEKHYGFVCDIEWAYESGKFYVVQSRPVTTLKNIENIPLEENNWHYWGEWKNTVLWAIPWYRPKRSKVFKKLGLNKLVSGRSVMIDGRFFTLQKDFDLLMPLVVSSIEGKSDWLKIYFKLCEEYSRKMVKMRKKLDLEEFLILLYELFSLSYLVRCVENCLEKYVKRICSDSNISYEKYVGLMIPDKKVPSSAYLEAIKKGDSNDKILKEFSWIGNNFYTGDSLLDSKRIEHDRSEKHKESKNNHCIMGLNINLKECLKIGSELIFIRTNIAEIFSMVSFEYFNELKELANKYNLKLADIMRLIPEEVIQLKKEGILPKNLKIRKDKFGVLSDGINVSLIYDIELKKISKKFEYLYMPSDFSDEILGISAYGGMVRGIARVVLNAKDVGRVGEGEIIIAPETTPDYILGMKKASAFVTNQGGITSHAAIIAREMQKPCVISTKVATLVIKDGDLIEVNANKGIVKILK